MRLTTTIFNALLGAYFASANEVRSHCNHKSLNTTSFNYVTDVANQTVHEMAVKFNRGVCDIGRANLSKSCHVDQIGKLEEKQVAYCL